MVSSQHRSSEQRDCSSSQSQHCPCASVVLCSFPSPPPPLLSSSPPVPFGKGLARVGGRVEAGNIRDIRLGSADTAAAACSTTCEIVHLAVFARPNPISPRSRLLATPPLARITLFLALSCAFPISRHHEAASEPCGPASSPRTQSSRLGS